MAAHHLHPPDLVLLRGLRRADGLLERGAQLQRRHLPERHQLQARSIPGKPLEPHRCQPSLALPSLT